MRWGLFVAAFGLASAVGSVSAQGGAPAGFGRFALDAPILAGSRVEDTDGSEIPRGGQRLEHALGLSVGGGFDVEWFRLEGRLEGGALFEPFSRVQPYLLPTIEPGLVLRLRHGLALSMGATAGVCVAQMLYGFLDSWVAGMVLGGHAGFEAPIGDGLRFQGRFGLAAYSPDGLSGPPRNPSSDGVFSERGWSLRASLSFALLIG